MTRMVCKHSVPIDMECADCKLEWLGDECEKDAKIARLREALGFYAERKNYQTSWRLWTPVDTDRGKLALAALKEAR